MPTLTGATAILSVAAGAGTPVVVGGPVTITGETALLELQANAGTPVVGTVVAGDLFDNPIALSESGGSFNANLSTTTLTTGEPDANGATHTQWFSLSPSIAGSITIHGSDTDFSYTIEHFSGTVLDELELVQQADYIVSVSTAEGELIQAVSAIGPHYFRIRGYNLAAGTDSSVHFVYTFGERLPELVVEVNTPVLQQTPANVLVSVVNAEPGEDVTFELIGYGVLLTQAADDSGIIQSASIPLPELAAGTYSLRSTGVTSGRFDDDSVQVTLSSDAAPTGPTADIPVVPVVQVGVRKWVVQDPTTAISYTFPINPTRMAAPHAPRFVEIEQTTAPDGTTHIWEGAGRAHTWSFEGFCNTQAFYEALQDYTALQNRLYLIDHRNRAWVVSFESFDPTMKKNGSNYWTCDYTVSALIFSGPEQLT